MRWGNPVHFPVKLEVLHRFMAHLHTKTLQAPFTRWVIRHSLDNLAVKCRNDDRRSPIAVGTIHVCAPFEQNIDDSKLPVLRGGKKHSICAGARARAGERAVKRTVSRTMVRLRSAIVLKRHANTYACTRQNQI